METYILCKPENVQHLENGRKRDKNVRAIQGPMSQLLYMSVLKQSPTGHPDVPGPPLAPKIILTLVECVSIYGTYQNISAGVYNPELLKTSQMLVCVAIAVPSAIGFLHRSSKAKSS